MFIDRIEIYNPCAFPTGVSPEKFIERNERPVRRNTSTQVSTQDKHQDNTQDSLQNKILE